MNGNIFFEYSTHHKINILTLESYLSAVYLQGKRNISSCVPATRSLTSLCSLVVTSIPAVLFGNIVSEMTWPLL